MQEDNYGVVLCEVMDEPTQRIPLESMQDLVSQEQQLKPDHMQPELVPYPWYET